MLAGMSHAAQAQVRWVDDEQVLAPSKLRLSLGYGHAWVQTPMKGAARMLYVEGDGASFEEALGMGRSLEVGARFGFRPARHGRALRADEVARGFETETFGTGISIVANPELRVRGRVFDVRWVEMGWENRSVLPIEPDPNLTEVLGGWASFHWQRIARLDIGINGVLGFNSYAHGAALQPALGVPVRAWFAAGQYLFAGAFFSLQDWAKTEYTAAHSRVLAGAVAGLRLGDCDLLAAVESRDVEQSLVHRMGYGLTLAWRP
jgi:hypothetical protein